MNGVMRASTEDMESAIGQQVRALRLAHNLSQENLAGQANVSLSSVRALERGEGSTLATFIKVLRALDALDWLTTLYPEPAVSPMALLREEQAKQRRVRPTRGSA